MQSAVTVSLVPQAKGGPFVFWNGLEDACVQAASLGFDAVEIFPPHGDALDIPAIRQLLTQHSLKVAAVGTGGGWVINKWTLTHPSEEVRKQAKGFIHDIIEKAAALGAPAILGSMQGRWENGVTREQALQWLGEAVDEFGVYAAKLGQVFLYEPLNRYETNILNRVPDVAAWLNGLQTKNVRILADLFHMNIEEANLPASICEAGALIGHVHFADTNRRAIGCGHTAVAPIVNALREIGYNGYLSAEIFPLPDPETAARQTMDSYCQFTTG